MAEALPEIYNAIKGSTVIIALPRGLHRVYYICVYSCELFYSYSSMLIIKYALLQYAYKRSCIPSFPVSG